MLIKNQKFILKIAKFITKHTYFQFMLKLPRDKYTKLGNYVKTLGSLSPQSTPQASRGRDTRRNPTKLKPYNAEWVADAHKFRTSFERAIKLIDEITANISPTDSPTANPAPIVRLPTTPTVNPTPRPPASTIRKSDPPVTNSRVELPISPSKKASKASLPASKKVSKPTNKKASVPANKTDSIPANKKATVSPSKKVPVSPSKIAPVSPRKSLPLPANKSLPVPPSEIAHTPTVPSLSIPPHRPRPRFALDTYIPSLTSYPRSYPKRQTKSLSDFPLISLELPESPTTPTQNEIEIATPRNETRIAVQLKTQTIGTQTPSSFLLTPNRQNVGTQTENTNRETPTRHNAETQTDNTSTQTRQNAATQTESTSMSASGSGNARDTGNDGNAGEAGGSGGNGGNGNGRARMDAPPPPPPLPLANQEDQRQIARLVAAMTMAAEAGPIGEYLRAQTERARSDNEGWKLSDIGVFSPEIDETGSSDPKYQGRDLIWRNVYSFIDQVRDAAGRNERRRAKIEENLHQLYRGKAQQWWIAILSQTERDSYKLDLDLHLRKLFKQFATSPMDAAAGMEAKYTKEDCLQNVDIEAWAMAIIRNCRALGLHSQVQHMTYVYKNLATELQMTVQEPAEGVLLDQWLLHLCGRQRAWRANLTANGYTPTNSKGLKLLTNLAIESESSSSASKQPTQDDADGFWTGFRGQTRGYRRDNDRRNDDDRRGSKRRDDYRDNDRRSGDRRNEYRDNDRRSGDRRDKGKKDYKDRAGRKDWKKKGSDQRRYRYPRRMRKWVRQGRRENGQVYIAQERLLEADLSDLGEQEDRLTVEGYFMLEEFDQVESASESESSSSYLKRFPSDSNIAKRTCNKCGKVFDTRSNCFKHIYANNCTLPKPKGSGPTTPTKRLAPRRQGHSKKQKLEYQAPTIEEVMDKFFLTKQEGSKPLLTDKTIYKPLTIEEILDEFFLFR
ncbi:hypothetical protein GGS26DRAFT_464319 [Hypomontagnella submonticulosa]|nr:hypothetical protein GGS26DRAFT_464319 [Hypomontagnella submonticulosa]